MWAEGCSVCTSWVPSPLFVASARRDSLPGPCGPRSQSVVEYRGLKAAYPGRTRGPPPCPPPSPFASLTGAW